MAKNVNLLSPTSNDGSIMDLYYHIAVGVRDFLKKMIENDILEKNKNIVNKLNWGQDKNNLKKENKRKKIIESCERLLDLNIDRKLVKTAIMVKPYNASIESRAKYLKENFKVEIRDNKECYLNKEGILLYSYDFTVYATVIDRVLSNEFKKMKELNKYLLRVSNICSELGLPIV
jgi:hypothetical protein